MTSRIEAFDRPIRFVDAQVRGPFGAYRHEHRFTEVADGTAMTDVVEIAAPLGPFGRPFERLVARYLKHLLEQRNEALSRAANNLR